ncbi:MULTISPECIES: cytochrome b562 [unclassified Acinetobacter]|uniref:cytochrome b562 n=1 Tax=unclassified Acinetobacter TaxID=196816 RepID=UPI0035BA9B76
MKKIICASLLAIASLTASQAFAGALGNNMEVMASSQKAFANATTPTAALTALTQMKNASNNARNIMPDEMRSVAATSPQAKQYQAVYDKLNAQIDRAIAFTKAGQLAQAKQLSAEMSKVMQEGHRKYK